MAKRRRIKKNVTPKVNATQQIQHGESNSEKDDEKVTSLSSCAKKQKLDSSLNREEGPTEEEKYVPPFTASQRVHLKLQVKIKKINNEENISTENEKVSQNACNIGSNEENKISEETIREESTEVEISAGLVDGKDKAVVENDEDQGSMNESAECLENSQVSKDPDKHFLESNQMIVDKELNNDGKTDNYKVETAQEKPVIEVPKLSIIIKKCYVDIESPDQKAKEVEAVIQLVNSAVNPGNSGSPPEKEKEHGKEIDNPHNKEKENGREYGMGNPQDKENERENRIESPQEKETEKSKENPQDKENETENGMENPQNKENENERENRIESPPEKETEKSKENPQDKEKETENGMENSHEKEKGNETEKGTKSTEQEGSESKSLDMINNQISSQSNATLQSNLPTSPQKNYQNQDTRTRECPKTMHAQKENEKKAITENIELMTENDEDKPNKNDEQPKVSLTSVDLVNMQQTDQMVPSDFDTQGCEVRERKAVILDEQNISNASCLSESGKTKENDEQAKCKTSHGNNAYEQSFAKEFEELEELLPKDDIGLFDDVMDSQLKSTSDETAEIPDGESTMKFLIDELSSLNCMVMNYQKTMDEMKRHYKLSNKF